MSPSTPLALPPTKPLHILIAGGSLSGLFTAITLQRLGHKITILERSPVPLLHDQGAGVVAGAETLQWVQRYGSASRRRAEDISVLSKRRVYLDREGVIIDEEERQQRMTSWGVLYGIGREGFDGGNGEAEGGAEGKDKVAYEHGCAVTGVERTDDGVQVTFTRTRTGETNSSSTSTTSTITGDFLIIADGPSSTLRPLLLTDPPPPPRTYAGYVALRGTVPESQLSPSSTSAFVESFAFFHGVNPNTQILAYTIPNAEGSLIPGSRLVNWVWYRNVEEGSEEYGGLMTDTMGRRHRYTLPTGGHMNPTIWNTQKDIATATLPPQFAELVDKTTHPFVQAITDLEPPVSPQQTARLLDGRAVLVGDALSGFRPHTAASTTQACYHALMLDRVFRGELGWEGYEERVWEFARGWQGRGVEMGRRSQFGVHPLVG